MLANKFVLDRIPATRIVATPAALDSTIWPANALALRLAADEVLLLSTSAPTLNDSYAIIEPDAGFAGVWLPMDEAQAIFAHHCEWAMPSARPALAQGAIAGIAAKVWVEAERVLILVPAPFVAEFEERLS